MTRMISATAMESQAITPSPRVPVPIEIRLAADRRSVVLVNDAGDAVRLSADALRRACRCAGCRRELLDATRPPPASGITVAQIAALGGRAVNIRFSDGHDRGVFPLDYLATLTPTPTEAAA